MTSLLTITDKGQVTFSKAILAALNISHGDKIAIQIKDKLAVIKPVKRGILDIAGTLPKFTIPKGKTLDTLIHEAREDSFEKKIC